jgi:aldehyde dehydrogenase (NAD+)
MITVESLQEMRSYFNTGATTSFAYRVEQLKLLQSAIIRYEQQIYEALKKDLNKSPEECWVTENGFVLSEIKYALSKLRVWMSPEKVSTNLLNLPSKSYIQKEPMGVVLIIAPWNYPLQLMLTPLVGALAAGNTVVLKASEIAPATAALIHELITTTFKPQQVISVIGHGSEVIPAMMNQFTFDHVFFTGSTRVGQLIYEMAAKRLVPVTLELGGKSPCIVESDANIKVTARRIASTKFSNAGQMCVAPDYLLVHESIKEEFLQTLKETLEKFYGHDAIGSGQFGKIIDVNHFNRLLGYLKQGEILYGGNYDPVTLTIAPTILGNVGLDAAVMKEEIFGPVLPVYTFCQAEEAMLIMEMHKNPLAFYVFTSSREKEKFWLRKVPCGGACINNSSWHLTNHHLPFGGRGTSGTGKYHGRYSFDCFSHSKAVLKSPTWFDPDVKYPPLKGRLGLLKKLIG